MKGRGRGRRGTAEEGRQRGGGEGSGSGWQGRWRLLQQRGEISKDWAAARCGVQFSASSTRCFSLSLLHAMHDCAAATPPEAAACAACRGCCCSYARRRRCARGRGPDRCCPAGASPPAAAARSGAPGWACKQGWGGGTAFSRSGTSTQPCMTGICRQHPEGQPTPDTARPSTHQPGICGGKAGPTAA